MSLDLDKLFAWFRKPSPWCVCPKCVGVRMAAHVKAEAEAREQRLAAELLDQRKMLEAQRRQMQEEELRDNASKLIERLARLIYSARRPKELVVNSNDYAALLRHAMEFGASPVDVISSSKGAAPVFMGVPLRRSDDDGFPRVIEEQDIIGFSDTPPSPTTQRNPVRCAVDEAMGMTRVRMEMDGDLLKLCGDDDAMVQQ
jgi:hypothetical protein